MNRVPRHTPAVIPGNAGDLLSMPLADSPAILPDIQTSKLSQDDARVDTRLFGGYDRQGVYAQKLG